MALWIASSHPDQPLQLCQIQGAGGEKRAGSCGAPQARARPSRLGLLDVALGCPA